MVTGGVHIHVKASFDLGLRGQSRNIVHSLLDYG